MVVGICNYAEYVRVLDYRQVILNEPSADADAIVICRPKAQANKTILVFGGSEPAGQRHTPWKGGNRVENDGSDLRTANTYKLGNV